MSEMLTYQFLRRGFMQGFLWDGPDDGGSDTGSGDPDPGKKKNGPADPPADPPSTEDQFTGLRSALDSERTERKKLEKQLRDIQRNQLPEGERLKAENEEKDTRIADLTKELTELRVGGSIEKIARELNFRRPERALRELKLENVDVSTLDSNDKIKTALQNLAKADADLVTTPPPSGGPINPADSNAATAGNEGMNQRIRQAAGRR